MSPVVLEDVVVAAVFVVLEADCVVDAVFLLAPLEDTLVVSVVVSLVVDTVSVELVVSVLWFLLLPLVLPGSVLAFSAAFSLSALSRSLSAAADLPPVFCCCSLCSLVVTPVVSESIIHWVCCCCVFCNDFEALVLCRDFLSSCL